MIKVAVIGGLILSGGKKNLIMEYFRHIDKTEVRIGYGYFAIMLITLRGMPS